MSYRSLSQLVFLLILFIFHFASVTATCPDDIDKDWSYDSNLPNGPPNWYKKYPNCKGYFQSPVNIVTRNTVSIGRQQRLHVNGYDKPIGEVSIMNNGHMIHVTPKDGIERSITLDGKKYVLKSFHFHWGNKTHGGSEDVINGERHTMETHFIHCGIYGTVAVAGFLEESYELNSALDNILAVRKLFLYKGEHFEDEIRLPGRDPHRRGRIFLHDLIDTTCPYYRYIGSMGFPPCNEGITWIICRKSKSVRRYQMNELFSLYSVRKDTPNADKCHLLNNYRPVQPLNFRIVYK